MSSTVHVVIAATDSTVVLLLPADGFTHLRVGFYILELVIIHHAKLTRPESLGNGARYFRLGCDHIRTLLLHGRTHFLFVRYCRRAALFGLGACHLAVGIGLGGLMSRAYVLV